MDATQPFAGDFVLRKRRKLSWELRARLDRASKASLIRSLPSGATVLDVGCGNSSPSVIKNFREDLKYSGADIGDYMITSVDKGLMEQYVVSPPAKFADAIRAFDQEFDLVLSSHNLEHCNDSEGVLNAMCNVVKRGGYIHLSFPSAASVNLPSRDGCLNFYDDPTHKTVLNFDHLVGQLSYRHFQVIRAVRRNRGTWWLGWLIGALQEPWSYASDKVRSYTWCFWGFESIIVARRLG